ncbi:TetR family transcriptional regulator [Paeniglutamicibacter sp. NPDC091659]|uniref:TetR/AcrR family transcriptional regulator n=1 Tax=Paeniglutamicibacter sp. NPDC091659 TaxID=3364389 RepID=UPI0038149764
MLPQTGIVSSLKGILMSNHDTVIHAAIVDAAQSLLADAGADTVDVVHVARKAGVDEATIREHFGSLDDLLAACLDLPFVPDQLLAEALSQAPSERGESVVRTMLRVWDSHAQAAMLALIGKVFKSEAYATLMRRMIRHLILDRVMADLGYDEEESRLRGSLAASQMGGLMLARYVIKLEPLASAGHDEIARLLGPVVQHYLTGTLEALPGTPKP